MKPIIEHVSDSAGKQCNNSYTESLQNCNHWLFLLKKKPNEIKQLLFNTPLLKIETDLCNTKFHLYQSTRCLRDETMNNSLELNSNILVCEYNNVTIQWITWKCEVAKWALFFINKRRCMFVATLYFEYQNWFGFFCSPLKIVIRVWILQSLAISPCFRIGYEVATKSIYIVGSVRISSNLCIDLCFTQSLIWPWKFLSSNICEKSFAAPKFKSIWTYLWTHSSEFAYHPTSSLSFDITKRIVGENNLWIRKHFARVIVKTMNDFFWFLHKFPLTQGSHLVVLQTEE